MKAPTKKKPKRRPRARYYIVALATFEGEDTARYLLGADPMWIVISASPTAGAGIIDSGYRSLKEAQEAWPEAVAPGPEMRPGDGRRFGWNRIPPVFSEPWFQAFWTKARKASARAQGG
jgi:hypothetical protein